jgi:hypothetical protein
MAALDAKKVTATIALPIAGILEETLENILLNLGGAAGEKIVAATATKSGSNATVWLDVVVATGQSNPTTVTNITNLINGIVLGTACSASGVSCANSTLQATPQNPASPSGLPPW